MDVMFIVMCSINNTYMVEDVTARASTNLDTVISLSSPPLSLVKFLSSVEIESCTMGFKYMFSSFPLPIGLVTPLERGGSSTCSILKEDKNSTRKGVKKIVR
jgi:hypothetical protein